MTHWGLRRIIPATLLLLMLAVGAWSFWATLTQYRTDLVTTARHDVTGDVARLGRLNDNTVGANAALAAMELAQVACRPETHIVAVTDERGLVLSSNKPAWRGRSLLELAPHITAERQGRVNHSRLPDAEFSRERLTVDALQSFQLASQEDEVRGTRRGMVYVEYDLRRVWMNALRQQAQARAPDLLSLIAVSLALAWLLDRHVARPLSALQHTANALRAGKWSTRVPRGGFAEIDQLARGLEAMRHELAATWHAMPDLLFEMDHKGVYLRVEAFRPEALAHPPHELLGRNIHDSLPPSAARTIQLALDEAERTGSAKGKEIVLDVPDGRRCFELSVARKEGIDGAHPTFILLSRDVTERKATEQALAQLQQEVAQMRSKDALASQAQDS